MQRSKINVNNNHTRLRSHRDAKTADIFDITKRWVNCNGSTSPKVREVFKKKFPDETLHYILFMRPLAYWTSQTFSISAMIWSRVLYTCLQRRHFQTYISVGCLHGLSGSAQHNYSNDNFHHLWNYIHGRVLSYCL